MDVSRENIFRDLIQQKIEIVIIASYNYTYSNFLQHAYKLHKITYIICHCVIIAIQQNTKSDFDVLCQLLGGCALRPPAFEAPFPFNLASVKLNYWLHP